MWPFGKKIKKSNVSLDVTEARTVESHCFISGNISVQGEVQFSGTLRVDGRIVGKVSSYPNKNGTLVVSKGAFVDGPVETTNIICDGTIHGRVQASNKLEVRSNGVINGEMHYDKLSTMEGAQLIGRCHQNIDKTPKLQEVGSPNFGHSLATRDTAQGSLNALAIANLGNKKSKF
ncbi:MAG: cytoskeletal protein CcmA (bactofilin family) [Alphaproteobacteria bacterium]|jgi:cytoskeletal protein CcmA (bactofilin family)